MSSPSRLIRVGSRSSRPPASSSAYSTRPRSPWRPALTVNGIGVRVARKSGPLLDFGVTLGSVAVHLFGAVRAGLLSGGVQLQLSDLAVGVVGRAGGNPIAQGLMADAGKGPNKLAPSFSPALAVQKHAAGPVLVSLSAGEGSGPWWLAIQKGLRPDLHRTGRARRHRRGGTARAHLAAARRPRLALRAHRRGRRSAAHVCRGVGRIVFDPSRWAVDLAGLAVIADLGGIVLAGGLRKFGDGDNVEYVGMLLARFAVYGLSVYGGYASGVVNGERFAAFFVFGAVNGPIGGPPAFFVTGHRRRLRHQPRARRSRPTCRTFGEFPFIKALDPARSPESGSDGRARAAARLLPDGARAVLVRRGHQLHQFRARRRHRRRRRSRSATDSRSRCSAWRGMALPRPQFAAGQHRARTHRPLLQPRRRAVDPGAAHRQLVDPERVGAAHGRVRLRHVVRRSESRSVRPDARRVPSAVQARRIPERARVSVFSGRSTTTSSSRARVTSR